MFSDRVRADCHTTQTCQLRHSTIIASVWQVSPQRAFAIIFATGAGSKLAIDLAMNYGESFTESNQILPHDSMPLMGLI